MRENIIYDVTHAEDVLFYAASEDVAWQLIAKDVQENGGDSDDYEIQEEILFE